MRKGQTIYYIEYFRGDGYNRNIKEATISKAGKIYFNVEGYRRECKVNTMRDGDYSDDHRRYFLSKQECDLFFERIGLEAIFKKFAASLIHTEIPIDKLRAIVEIIKETK